MTTVYIYALADPRDDMIRYIGKSVRPKRRLIEHLRDTTTNSEKIAWLNDLEILGLKPRLKILDRTNEEDSSCIEMDWIAHGLDAGWPLTNFATGLSAEKPPGELYLVHVHPRLRGLYKNLDKSQQDHICMKAVQVAAFFAIGIPLSLRIRTGPVRSWLNVIGWGVAHCIGHAMILRTLVGQSTNHKFCVMLQRFSVHHER